MGNIKSRALLYLYFVNLFIKKQSTPHHRDKQRKSRKRAVSNRPKKPILRQPPPIFQYTGLYFPDVFDLLVFLAGGVTGLGFGRKKFVISFHSPFRLSFKTER